jgi:hypothetical protein
VAAGLDGAGAAGFAGCGVAAGLGGCGAGFDCCAKACDAKEAASTKALVADLIPVIGPPPVTARQIGISEQHELLGEFGNVKADRLLRAVPAQSARRRIYLSFLVL